MMQRSSAIQSHRGDRRDKKLLQSERVDERLDILSIHKSVAVDIPRTRLQTGIGEQVIQEAREIINSHQTVAGVSLQSLQHIQGSRKQSVVVW